MFEKQKTNSPDQTRNVSFEYFVLFGENFNLLDKNTDAPQIVFEGDNGNTTLAIRNTSNVLSGAPNFLVSFSFTHEILSVTKEKESQYKLKTTGECYMEKNDILKAFGLLEEKSLKMKKFEEKNVIGYHIIQFLK